MTSYHVSNPAVKPDLDPADAENLVRPALDETTNPQGQTEPSRPIYDRHLAMLCEESGIDDAVIKSRGYWTASRKSELRDLGFTQPQRRVPALVIPIHDVHGEIASYQIRPDNPRVIKGCSCKYEMPRGTPMVMDVPPTVRPYIGDPSKPLFITEGIKKADAIASHDRCVLGLIGVWTWRGTNDAGGKTVLADFESVDLNGRQVYIVFDSDVMVNPYVHQALARLRAFLQSRKANVSLVYLPAKAGGEKQGVDDFLAAGHSIDDVVALATPKLKSPPQDEPESPYKISDDGILWRRQTRDGTVDVPLTNFPAEIVADVVIDDGVEQSREFSIQARVRGRDITLNIPAAEYAGMAWVTQYLGADALMFPGQSLKDHARFAIQKHSTDIERRTIYAHLGWRRTNEEWIYLHAAGQIGQHGQVRGERVQINDALAHYMLPDPPNGDDLRRAIQQSMCCLDVAPRGVTIPLYGCVWRAVLGAGDFSVHLCGPTGHGKTALVALLQQHSGAAMDAQHLPANWTSTANALESLAFAAKDSLLVVDEFTPTDSTQSQVLHRTAERLFRAQANGAGRQRMRADTTLRPAKPPRGLILSTGEDVPHGMSLRARMLIIELEPNTVDFSMLTDCQSDAAAGIYAQAMAGFIQWLSPQMDRIRETWRDDLVQLRREAAQSDMHRRTPENIASLVLGWRYFLMFAEASGVMSAPERKDKEQEVWETLGVVAQSQGQHQATAEPAARFLHLLRDCLASGKAHLRQWQPEGATLPQDTQSGVCVGWDDEKQGRVYLLPSASYAAAQELGRVTGNPVVVSEQTLRKRLHEQGHIAETEPSRETIVVRKTIDGKRTRVFSIHRVSLFSEADQPAQPDQASKLPPESDSIGQVLPDQWSGSKPPPDHNNLLINNDVPSNGQVGQVRNVTDSKNINPACACSSCGQVDSKNLTSATKKPDQSGETLDAGDDEEVF
jgi:Domain of unknown function (DUF3854)/Domain of unknown function (DUF927)